MNRSVTSIRITGRHHLHVGYNRRGSCWQLQPATPTRHGYSLGEPIETGFKTKRTAEQRKRELLGLERSGD